MCVCSFGFQLWFFSGYKMSTNSISKRTENNTDVEVSNTDALPDSAVTKSEAEDVVHTSMAIFHDDILLEVFDNLGILTAKDLLRFRLVNRCWRDAATSVLLKRNLCEIALDFGRVAFLPRDKFFNVYQPRNVLPDLSALISTSLKFPSTSINFSAIRASAFGNLCRKSDSDSKEEEDVDQNQNDLLHFLDLYGKKIKKIALCRDLSRKAAQKLLYVYMPHLTCLDFRQFAKFACNDDDEDDNYEVNQQIQVCEIEEIILGYESGLLRNEYDFVKELFEVCPKMSSIQNVDVYSLVHLFEMGKCHFIKSLLLDLKFHQMYEVKECFKYNLSTLKLSKLMIQLTNRNGDLIKYDVLLKFLNIILSAMLR